MFSSHEHLSITPFTPQGDPGHHGVQAGWALPAGDEGLKGRRGKFG